MSPRFSLAALFTAALLLGAAFSQVELRMTWYDDGNEGQVMRELLDRFEAANPDVRIVMDTVPYSSGILQSLPLQLASGDAADMVRVTNLGGLSEYWLDMSPHLSNPDYWETNFGPFLDWMRPAGSQAIPGFMTQLTVTGPYINRTLFDQAGIAVPTGDTTWQEWAEVTRAVADATGTPFAMVMDRTGHRLAGPAISQGASFFGEDGHATIDDEGMRTMMQLMIDWHADGTMHPDTWIGSAGTYVAGNEFFINAQVVLYMSGSWQVGQFANLIGDAFDWEVIPNPCGPMACTGMPGGAGVVGVANTDHPAEVARVMEFLTQEDVMAEFYGRTLFIPGHLGLAESGIDFQTDVDAARDALSVFASEVPRLDPTAYAMQAYPFNFVVFDSIRDRLTQAFVGELTLDEVLERAQADIDEVLREQGIR
ncbi:MAG: carbohydrate ABC transporter substrate-binding protein [Trueperaceae bacterium]|nr:MAG: carbohydrate ABC transporter substrate-binding protein [Trueperaceae bacterium]